MSTNSTQLIVRIVNPADVVVIKKECPYSSESERMAYGQNLMVKMFSVGVFKETKTSEMIGIPPHRIKDVTIRSV